MDLVFCDGGGALVGAELPIPDDPTDPYLDRYLEIHGCNRIHCAACGADVLQRTGLGQVPGFDPPPDAAAIYSAQDWTSVPGIVAVADSRLYACRCAWWTENFQRGLDALRDDPAFGVPGWRCAGHPRPELPFKVDGVEIALATDIPTLVARALRREIPASKEAALDSEAKARYRSGQISEAIALVDAAEAEKRRRLRVERWLIRLFLRIEMSVNGAQLLPRLAAAVIDHLSDPDATIRSYCIQFLTGLPQAPGREVLVDLFEGDRKLFKGVLDPRSLKDGGTLEELLVFAVGVLCDQGSVRARDSVRAALLRGESVEPERLVFGLVDVDTQWILEHAEQVVRRNPRLLEKFLFLALERANFADTAIRLVGLPWIDKASTRDFVAKQFPAGMPLGEKLRAALDRTSAN
jgi:hypothetical protein